jgi:NitT/TauT family transport system ATP-binding protein
MSEEQPTTMSTEQPGTADDRQVVRLSGVDKVFSRGGQPVTTALEGIDLTIQRGEFVSLIGPSGCGKSTLLRLIGDLVAPTRGEVIVNGKTAERARRDRDYGMVFQAPVLFEWRTVEDNVKLPLEILGRPAEARAARAREMLDLVELGEFAKHYPYQLSGGMQQRVAIARALSFEPAILLMDEPFGALDALTRIRMHRLLRTLCDRYRPGVLLVTHDVDEAVLLADRILVLTEGRMSLDLPVDLPSAGRRHTPEFTELRTRLLTELGVEDDDQ